MIPTDFSAEEMEKSLNKRNQNSKQSFLKL